MDSIYEPMGVSPASRGGDAWNKIPSWDGDPRTCKRFEVDAESWLEGEDWWRISYTWRPASSSDRRGPRGHGPSSLSQRSWVGPAP